jgi:hypothetical protein
MPNPATGSSRIFDVFLECVDAITSGTLVRRESRRDKEFHFQDWFAARLRAAKVSFDQNGRNAYPDFVLTQFAEGYEVKGLAWPGREANFDSNSQVPAGHHNGRDIYYVFGRYPAEEEGDEYPVVDLVLCHGNFLNADREYIHENKNVKGFGTYGDIMIRDRKMYVVPTPFALTDGTTGQQTLILPAETVPGSKFVKVGDLIRSEADRIVVAYTFDLRTNKLIPQDIPNPNAGKKHPFSAYRPEGRAGKSVSLKTAKPVES